jgi:cathepsin B
MLILLFFSLLFGTLACKRDDFARIIKRVNSSSKLWRAGFDPTLNYDQDELLLMLASGARDDQKILEQTLLAGRRRFLQRRFADVLLNEKKGTDQLPEFLDLRLKYPRCRSLRIVRNQSVCSSCWAFAAMNCISDAFCISKLGRAGSSERFFSPQDSLECCLTCQFDTQNPCAGGYLYQAFKYAKINGVVSGDGHNSSALCKPYYLPEIFTALPAKPTCSNKCTSTSQVVEYATDKFKITDFTYGRGVVNLMTVLNTMGSVAVTMRIYQDFLTYQKGIYKYESGTLLGNHAVRIIGYGTESGTDYWLGVNSWGTSWGERGFFKIVKGVNECEIEADFFFVPLIK